MKELVLNYEDTEQLMLVIEDAYFIKGNLGKRFQQEGVLTVNPSDTIYTVLKGMDCNTLRIKNNGIIGSLKCQVITDNDVITLKPMQDLCVKEYKKYTFY